LRAVDESQAANLARELGIVPVLARLLAARGVQDAAAGERFLHPSLAHLHEPGQMLGMGAAVERLGAAVAGREKILIYGDYDVDGTTAIVILKTAIELCGGRADYHVPHRLREGYGMRDEVIERAAAEGARLVISVDTGIRAFAAAEAAQRAGVDLIVTDHHLPEGTRVPPALAVLNPNQPGCAYPCKALCGAAVAFKLAQALLEKNKDAGDCARLLPSFLKMVAVATIADAVPLLDENRVIAKLGLEALRRPVNRGLKALLEAAAIDGARRSITSSEIAFRFAPRINAAGRMDVARDVIELFTSPDQARCLELAAKLNQLNAERQQEEKRILAEINQRLERDPELRRSFCIVVDGDRWHRGVIGIAATRVVELTGKPALVVTREGEEAHGSGRSIPAFHLLEALESCRELFTRFGGHAHAVGFALPAERLPELRAAVDSWARARLTPADFEPVLEIDAELRLEEISSGFFEQLRRLEPFGMGNREPVFVTRAARVLSAPQLLKEQHFKMRVSQPAANGQGRAFEALAWRMAERLGRQALEPGDVVDLAFRLEENRHPGDDLALLQLSIRDFHRPAAP